MRANMAGITGLRSTMGRLVIARSRAVFALAATRFVVNLKREIGAQGL